MKTARKINFLKHVHPPQVRRRTLHPLTTLGLGIASLTCLGILFVTGLTLFMYYVPAQGAAYERVIHIATTLRYGRLVRNLHYVTANALLILAALHMARVFFTGSYKGRWLNWNYGLGLLFLILMANYTGYLLPWNQRSFWAIKVGSTLAEYVPLIGSHIKSFMLGGEDISHDTLLRTFSFHAGIIPLFLLLLTSQHLWRIRKSGGLAGPQETDEEKLPSSPWLHRAELSVMLLTLSALLILALLVQAPLAERADPLHPPNPAKAQWYFVGIQEMVSHSAMVGGVIVPALIGFFLVFAPMLDRSASAGGRWFSRDRWAINLIFALILLSQILFIAIGQWFRTKDWMFHFPF